MSSVSAIRTVGAGILFGILGTVLTFQRQVGLGFTVLSLVLLGGLITIAYVHQIRPVRRNLVMMLPILFFTLMLTIRSDAHLTVMNVCASLVAVLLLSHFYRSGNLLRQNVLEYLLKAVASGITVCFQPLNELLQSSKWLATHKEGLHSLIPILRGSMITLPVVAVFVILLGSADEVFSRLVSDIIHLFTFKDPGSLTRQILYAMGISWAVIGCFAAAMIERKVKRAPQGEEMNAEADGEIPQYPTAPIIGLGYTETVMLLGSVCVLFTAFVLIQFVYLFGGERNIANYSYADYVHRGFAELVLVALLTLGLGLTLNAIAIRRTHAQASLVRALSTLLMLLTGIILMSAFQRLRLYELTYGFTSLRLLIYVFIGWLGVALAGFTLSLYWTPRTINVFSTTALIAVFGFAGTLDILNPDAFVAWQNISRGDVDPLHLWTLSEEAAPTLAMLVDAPEPGLRRVVRYTLANYRNRLSMQNTDWRDFSLGRANVLAVLDSVRDKLDTTDYASIWGGKFKVDDFANLWHGMSVRAVARQFGFPYSSSGTDFYSEFSQRENKLSLTYILVDGGSIELQFDSSAGLISMCVKAVRYGSCSSLPLAS